MQRPCTILALLFKLSILMHITKVHTLGIHIYHSFFFLFFVPRHLNCLFVYFVSGMIPSSSLLSLSRILSWRIEMDWGPLPSSQ